MWQEPIFDRTNADTLTARAGQSNIDNHKGALNYQDLNRIEENFQYVVQHLFDNAMVIPHMLRHFTETVLGSVEKEPSVLPEGYTQVEYIESSGTQYIDTGFIPNQDTRVTLSAYNTSESSGWTYGVWESASSKQFCFSCLSTYSFRYGTSSASLINVPVGSVEVDQNKNVYNLNGITGTITAQTFTCSHSMYLFCINANGSPSGGKFFGKLYSCRIYDRDVLVRDFVPCINSSGKAGLYDLVEGKFYGNVGSGSFATGAEVKKDTIYELTEIKTTYTDWQEQNIPWLSEIDRIRQNFNNLIALFLRTLDLPTFPSNIYLMYSEVNDWERVSLVGKTMFENMEKEYVYSGTIDCGGDRLL